MISRHGLALRRTARRFSIDAGDAEDAYQRALEIVLTKAPTTDPRELIRWTQTVIKHEALAVRRNRERLLGPPPPAWREDLGTDPLAALPSRTEGPEEQVERREEIARAREALRVLKPAELRALSLLAEGYSYAEIGELTGFSQTKVNRVLAEGRSRFRDLISRSEDGRRCRELRPLLSTFCDGEASGEEAETMREHLRACASCRATMRAYRTAPALVPALVPSSSLLGRLRDLLTRLGSQLSGTAKVVTAGVAGTAACVAAGVVPVPIPHSGPVPRSSIQRTAGESGPVARAAKPEPEPRRQRHRPRPATETTAQATRSNAVPVEPVEYEPPLAPPAEPAPSATESGSSGSAAGEFGP